MGRLFWKFFFAILFAQLVTTVGVGATFWVWDQARDNAADARGRGAHIDTSPSAGAILDAAALTLKYGGMAGLRELAASATSRSVYALDVNGADLLGREVSSAMRTEMDRLFASGEHGGVVRSMSSPEGQHLIVFVRRSDWPGRGFRMPPPPDVFGEPGPHRPRGGPSDAYRLPYITMAVGTLASLLFAALLAWYFSRPIRALRDAFEAAAMGDLAPRFGAGNGGRRDELADLGHDFDRMSAQLRALMDNQRRLLHDVSHELRSPLARLQAAIGLAHQQPDKLATSLERIERESARMDKLVGELLTLSRLETASALPAAETFAIMEMVQEIAADAHYEAASQARQVQVTGSTTAQVSGTPDLLWRAIENVVRNAVKHSPPDGTAEVALESTATAVLVHVLDRGPGVDSLDLATIFEPFFRSHPNANNIDGHGLGLAIAQRVVAAHGGTIVAANRAGGGLRVTISLPVA
ncbi:MAG: HAMP domain-containing sensor histidine kinase [Pseudomonadota bacterium]